MSCASALPDVRGFTIEQVPGAFVVAGRGVRAVFTTRAGPVRGGLGGTNLSATVGDDPAAVAASREWAAGLAGLEDERLTFGYQVHGAGVRRVADTSAAVGVAPSPLADTDALVTATPGVGIGVLAADCVPTLIAAEGAVAVVHSGWRGLLAGVLEAAQEALDELGADTAEAVAFSGPAIGVCCYEVSEELARRFAGRFPGTVARAAGAYHLDLRRAASLALTEVGVAEVVQLGPCTRCDPRMWSHRRGDTGRQGLVAAVEPR